MPKTVIGKHLSAVFQAIDFLTGGIVGEVAFRTHLLDQRRAGLIGQPAFRR